MYIAGINLGEEKKIGLTEQEKASMKEKWEPFIREAKEKTRIWNEEQKKIKEKKEKRKERKETKEFIGQIFGAGDKIAGRISESQRAKYDAQKRKWKYGYKTEKAKLKYGQGGGGSSGSSTVDESLILSNPTDSLFSTDNLIKIAIVGGIVFAGYKFINKNKEKS